MPTSARVLRQFDGCESSSDGVRLASNFVGRSATELCLSTSIAWEEASADQAGQAQTNNTFTQITRRVHVASVQLHRKLSAMLSQPGGGELSLAARMILESYGSSMGPGPAGGSMIRQAGFHK
ncbi:hypothetical protein B0H16DRAFT_1455844 [Mycena metata]|uniref:Uncharacterized protein n=1 Tax=Mycena metata TaxID=1033252 RepID=A0AAD7JEX4_9AGAR|nr:hypothetical protein B0H16DRAFT_1455844 [Mycena metata]